MKLSPQSARYMLFLGALAALAPVATDLILPSIASIAESLATTPHVAGLALGLFMFGFAAGPIGYGPLADRYGRRPVLLAGLTVYGVASAVCVLTPSVAVLLCARVLQGAGAGAGMTLAYAMLRDQFEGAAAQSRMAVITIVANTAPIVSPAIGAGLLPLIGWRGVFAVILGYGAVLAFLVIFAIGETLPSLRSKQQGPGGTGASNLSGRDGKTGARGMPGASTDQVMGFGALLRHPVVRPYVLLNGLGFAWMFAYVSASPLVLLGLLHVSGGVYSGMFACTGLGIVVGATLGERLARRGVAGDILLAVGLACGVAAPVALLCLSALNHVTLGSVMPWLVIGTFGFGMVAPNAAHGALTPVPESAGAASGLMTSIQMTMGAIASVVVVLLFPALGLNALTVVMGASAVMAVLVFISLQRSLRAA